MADPPAANSDPPFKKPNAILRPFLLDKEPTEVTIQTKPPRSPAHFNPDPGKWDSPSIPATQATPSNPTPTAPTAAPPANPSPDETKKEREAAVENFAPDFAVLFPSDRPVPIVPGLPAELQLPPYEGERLDPRLALPRRGVKGLGPVHQQWTYPKYQLGREGLGLFPHSTAVPNRWFLNFPGWRRYQDPSIEAPYQYETPLLWHPYRQSTLKGDVPIIGQDIFLEVTAKNFSLFEGRKLPVGSGVSAAQPSSSEFFGRGNQFFISNDTSLEVNLFQGETGFKPVDWAIRIQAVENRNWLWVQENNLIDPNPLGSNPPGEHQQEPPNSNKIQSIPKDGSSVNPRTGDPGTFGKTINPADVFNFIAPSLQPTNGARDLVKTDPVTNQPVKGKKGKVNNSNRSDYTERARDFFALQEAFAEIHFSDLSNNYDFISGRFGIQPFVSDFRGFIFNDTNLGARIFGNYDNNRIQYNLALFDMREKDTYSGLNEIDTRQQRVLIANVFKQDFFAKGYTAEFSFHGNFDDGGVHYDKNEFLTRPAPFGTVQTDESGHIRGHDVNAFYLGWTGDGHIGRFNITHAFYEVVGRDSYNSLAGREVSINAQMAALELSYDANWIRFKLSGFYASGSSNPTSGVARGFDSILDNPTFIGGPFSWYVHEAPNLAGTGVNLKQPDSLIPDLRTSKTEGQSNFVNPGVAIVGFGIDTDITPKLKGFFNANYIWFAETAPIKLALQTNDANNKFGLDLSLGIKYRPLLTDNIIVSLGGGLFIPGQGYKDIYRTNTGPITGFSQQNGTGKVDPVLYNAFLTVTFTY